jgi:hypothetical protein
LCVRILTQGFTYRIENTPLLSYTLKFYLKKKRNWGKMMMTMMFAFSSFSLILILSPQSFLCLLWEQLKLLTKYSFHFHVSLLQHCLSVLTKYFPYKASSFTLQHCSQSLHGR